MNKETLMKMYPIGTRIELVKMDDIQAPPVGTQGTVIGVDDMLSLQVAWDNGSSLNVVYGEDIVRKVQLLTPTIKKQILAIRDSGETNMFDTNMVQFLANRSGYYELVIFLEEHKREYVQFILTGKEA